MNISYRECDFIINLNLLSWVYNTNKETKVKLLRDRHYYDNAVLEGYRTLFTKDEMPNLKKEWTEAREKYSWVKVVK